MTALVVAVGLAVLQYYSAEWITGGGVMTMNDSLIVVAAQSLNISVSLAVASQSVPGLEATAPGEFHTKQNGR